MKKTVLISLVLSVLLTAVFCVSADDGLFPGTSSEVPAGVYKAGTDFPAGSYLIDCANPDEGCCYSLGSSSMRRLFSGADLSGEGAYQICNYYSGGPLHMIFDNGDVLQSGEMLRLTVADPVALSVGTASELPMGFYRAGTDIPAGSYSLRSVNADYGCSLYLGSDSLMKLNTYVDGVIPQYIDVYIYEDTDYHIFLEEDAVFRVTDSFSMTPAEPLSFN